jgi:hypothetical protein
MIRLAFQTMRSSGELAKKIGQMEGTVGVTACMKVMALHKYRPPLRRPRLLNLAVAGPRAIHRRLYTSLSRNPK